MSWHQRSMLSTAAQCSSSRWWLVVRGFEYFWSTCVAQHYGSGIAGRLSSSKLCTSRVCCLVLARQWNECGEADRAFGLLLIWRCSYCFLLQQARILLLPHNPRDYPTILAVVSLPIQTKVFFSFTAVFARSFGLLPARIYLSLHVCCLLLSLHNLSTKVVTLVILVLCLCPQFFVLFIWTLVCIWSTRLWECAIICCRIFSDEFSLSSLSPYPNHLTMLRLFRRRPLWSTIRSTEYSDVEVETTNTNWCLFLFYALSCACNSQVSLVSGLSWEDVSSASGLLNLPVLTPNSVLDLGRSRLCAVAAWLFGRVRPFLAVTWYG